MIRKELGLDKPKEEHEKKKKEEEEEEEEDDFVISGPCEVEHLAHAEKGTEEDVRDAIDNVELKTREVDCEDIYVEEIVFAEEYNPDL